MDKEVLVASNEQDLSMPDFLLQVERDGQARFLQSWLSDVRTFYVGGTDKGYGVTKYNLDKAIISSETVVLIGGKAVKARDVGFEVPQFEKVFKNIPDNQPIDDETFFGLCFQMGTAIGALPPTANEELYFLRQINQTLCWRICRVIEATRFNELAMDEHERTYDLWRRSEELPDETVIARLEDLVDRAVLMFGGPSDTFWLGRMDYLARTMRFNHDLASAIARGEQSLYQVVIEQLKELLVYKSWAEMSPDIKWDLMNRYHDLKQINEWINYHDTDGSESLPLTRGDGSYLPLDEAVNDGPGLMRRRLDPRLVASGLDILQDKDAVVAMFMDQVAGLEKLQLVHAELMRALAGNEIISAYAKLISFQGLLEQIKPSQLNASRLAYGGDADNILSVRAVEAGYRLSGLAELNTRAIEEFRGILEDADIERLADTLSQWYSQIPKEYRTADRELLDIFASATRRFSSHVDHLRRSKLDLITRRLESGEISVGDCTDLVNKYDLIIKHEDFYANELGINMNEIRHDRRQIELAMEIVSNAVRIGFDLGVLEEAIDEGKETSELLHWLNENMVKLRQLLQQLPGWVNRKQNPLQALFIKHIELQRRLKTT